MKYSIRHINQKELETAIEWAATEGWNPGLYDADAFDAMDPQGYFMGYVDNEPVASISAVSYPGQFGFLGFYIVKPEYRGKGYGWKLWQEAMKYLNSHNVGLDGVVAQQENYKKSGFTRAYANIRYEGIGSNSVKKSKNIVPLSKVSFDELLKYDREVFPADRSSFLKIWFNQPKSLALGYIKDGKLLGFGMVRPCRVGYKVGPLFADNEKIAEELFQQFRVFVRKEKIYLDVPEVNKKAVFLAKKYKMVPMFETARMYTKEMPQIDLHKIFGVTTFELG
ncbi:MAG: GCN5-related N-acetyltransferase [Candidatus Collierbacteria bacterium GW2011_GWB1_44_6]|uniref:GCN5-related N-acetyltransferase n=2 Tax=Candidatus Collieribacteriota TaxID=1752725 RepID=A0A0G1MLC1_9BACT|nr:MAG: GCN5-related N-acetyltransferase [Candidatus Collierbacteria bacterium GW2011_GWC2_43_12]KKT72819.1 MAG: GCN5-related N-acetyltransferase [Candidatus Collierbacteria bacterium GW2011_GWB1_44_6]